VHSATVVLVVSVFLASSVEMVEALTIVVAVGVTRGWRFALQGAALAIACLAAVVAAAGPALVHYVPLDVLRVVVGGLLLVFGLQWLRKAVLRAAGAKAKHDEDAIFARQVAELRGEAALHGESGWGTAKVPGASGGPGVAAAVEAARDPVAVTVAFKGVLLEGLEVVVIVLTLGVAAHRLAAASIAAGVAVLTVTAIGMMVARQLSGVPENAMKMTVGVMLVSFGSFWTGEGLGVHWFDADASLPILVGGFAVVAFVAVRLLKRDASAAAADVDDGATPVADPASTGSSVAAPPSVVRRAAVAFGRFWWEFLVGETPEVLSGAAAVVGTVALMAHNGVDRSVSAVATPVLVVAVLAVSLQRGRRGEPAAGGAH